MTTRSGGACVEFGPTKCRRVSRKFPVVFRVIDSTYAPIRVADISTAVDAHSSFDVPNVTSERCAKSGRARRSENRFPSFGRWTRRCCWTLVHAQSEVSEGASERLGMQSPPAVPSREYPAAAPNRGARCRSPCPENPVISPVPPAEVRCCHVWNPSQGGGTGSNPVGGTLLKPLEWWANRPSFQGFRRFGGSMRAASRGRASYTKHGGTGT